MMARANAAQRGEKKYLGSPCKQGHDGWRYTTSGGCIQCVIATNQTYRDKFLKMLAEAKK